VRCIDLFALDAITHVIRSLFEKELLLSHRSDFLLFLFLIWLLLDSWWRTFDIILRLLLHLIMLLLC